MRTYPRDHCSQVLAVVGMVFEAVVIVAIVVMVVPVAVAGVVDEMVVTMAVIVVMVVVAVV